MYDLAQVPGFDTACGSGTVHSSAVPRRPPFRLSDIWKAPLTDLPVRDEIIFQYLPLAPDMDVLEIGPGGGFAAFRLCRLVRSLTLMDVAAKNIERLRKCMNGIPNMEFVSADICNPRAVDVLHRRFDVIEAVEVFEFLPDPETALNNMSKLLRPGGLLFLQFPNYEPRKSRGVTYFRQRSDFARLLEQAGFDTWQVYALQLRPHADFLYRNFHEKPMGLYRRIKRNARPKRPLTYDEVWFSQNESRLQKYRPILHLAWMGFMAGMHLGGRCFERTCLTGTILNHNLLVIAARAKDREIT